MSIESLTFECPSCRGKYGVALGHRYACTSGPKCTWSGTAEECFTVRTVPELGAVDPEAANLAGSVVVSGGYPHHVPCSALEDFR